MDSFSLYIHIPFCKKKCNYCDFTSFDDARVDIDDYLDALIAEIKALSRKTKGQRVYSIFIGGGTPSLLSSEQITRLFTAINNGLKIDRGAEITIECNPGTLTREKALSYKGVGINRISLGLQSTHDHHLNNLGRIHSYDAFLDNYNMLREEGFNNINVDLMFGLPNQTLEEWEQTISDIIRLKPEHISKYSLSIEKGTPFYNKYKEISNILNEELERRMYYSGKALLEQAGYRHYEISNYSLEGYGCCHNVVYWTLRPYIGVGISAASFYENKRFGNTNNIYEYMNQKGSLELMEQDYEQVSEKALMEEYMFLGLRLLEGVSKQAFELRFGQSIDGIYGDTCDRLVSNGLIKEQGGQIALTHKGIDISNHVLSQFLLD